ncbi:MAG: hypothetical protein J3Q66DRAFT_373252 [Benniella sp.]|nr:MAG: hypothetical protein J3Q66DRAFT_373252 [Benniella sp.]
MLTGTDSNEYSPDYEALSKQTRVRKKERPEGDAWDPIGSCRYMVPQSIGEPRPNSENADAPFPKPGWGVKLPGQKLAGLPRHLRIPQDRREDHPSIRVHIELDAMELHSLSECTEIQSPTRAQGDLPVTSSEYPLQNLAEDQVEVRGMRRVDDRHSRVALANLGFRLPTSPWTSHSGVFLRKKKLARCTRRAIPSPRCPLHWTLFANSCSIPSREQTERLQVHKRGVGLVTEWGLEGYDISDHRFADVRNFQLSSSRQQLTMKTPTVMELWIAFLLHYFPKNGPIYSLSWANRTSVGQRILFGRPVASLTTEIAILTVDLSSELQANVRNFQLSSSRQQLTMKTPTATELWIGFLFHYFPKA